MKIAAHQVAGVVADPSRVAGMLFHGDDLGRVRALAAAATQAVLGAAADPFRLSILVREEHPRLREEATSLALGGGRRVIRVQDATDGLAAIVAELAAVQADTLLLLEGPALTAKSKLRAWAEKSPHWAVIACYPEQGAAVAQAITRQAAEAGLNVEPGALAYLTQELAGDSSRRRAELEKLCLYSAGQPGITLADAEACCATGLDATLTAAASAALSGQTGRCEALLAELAEDGASGPGMLAVLGSQVQRALKVRLLMQGGRTAEQACQELRPPVFPRQAAALVQEVRPWTEAGLVALAAAVREADIACKRAASPDFAIAGRLLALVAARAARP